MVREERKNQKLMASIFYKRWMIFFAVLTSMTMAFAQNKAWATLNNGTLTFSYGAKPTIGKVFGVQPNAQQRGDIPWEEAKSSIRHVVFEPSFKQAKISTTCAWFANAKSMESISGLEYLDTKNVTTMQEMFCFCYRLQSIDVSKFCTSNVEDFSGMFFECQSLTSIDISSFNTSRAKDMHAMFDYCKNLKTVTVSASGWKVQGDEGPFSKGLFNNCPATVVKKQVAPLTAPTIPKPAGEKIYNYSRDLTEPVFKYDDGKLHVGFAPDYIWYMRNHFRRPPGMAQVPEVRLTFVVEKNGTISNITFFNSEVIGQPLVSEITRLLTTMPKWTPAKLKKNGTSVRYIIKAEVEIDNYGSDGGVIATPKEDTNDNDKIYDICDQMPEFPGGPKAMVEWLNQNLKYPAGAKAQGKQGRVVVLAVIEKDGSVSNTKAIRSADPALDAEAIRVIKAMPKWKPGKMNGQTVRCNYTIPVLFKL